MAASAFLSLLFILCTAISSSVRAEDVVALNPDSFEVEVGKEKHALVEFYAPWCGHCKKLAPEYEKLGSSFKKSKSVLIAKVDCDDHKSLCTKYGVSGFPTIKWFPKGSLEPKDYSGGRTVESLVDFVNQEAGTHVKVSAPVSDVAVLTPENFDSIALDESKDVLVEFYAPWCGHCKNLAPVYDQVATAFKGEKDVVIAKVDADSHKGLGEKYGVSGYPTLKFFPKNNKAGEDYEGGRDLDDFVAFINEKTGTSRDSKGLLTAEAGKLPSLSALVEEFVAAEAEAQKDIVTKIEDEVAKLTGTAASYGKLYVKIAHKTVEKGEGYAKKEVERLERLLSGHVNPTKVDELTLKKNVCSLFVKYKSE
ncbi:hypothetical protein KP509_12G069100 [Ceratopteris richardii]|uniref:protein disulfide-isomerase n=1 Tax=Ceratopteris richardii TaxID=49495 RepID=A0A8T2TLX0_CERRI|nr:hypothetical protein KP509_12G069100 [Ceratopteris richardii]